MTDQTARLALPLLASGQAQKEITHNEALTLADMLIQPVVQAGPLSVPPAAPVAGQCWIVGTAASGAWTGHDGAIAGWTTGGWRFCAAFEGMAVWSLADQLWVLRTASGWAAGIVAASEVRVSGQKVLGARQAAIAAPTGGSVADTEARLAINAVLAALRTHGLISV